MSIVSNNIKFSVCINWFLFFFFFFRVCFLCRIRCGRLFVLDILVRWVFLYIFFIDFHFSLPVSLLVDGIIERFLIASYYVERHVPVPSSKLPC